MTDRINLKNVRLSYPELGEPIDLSTKRKPSPWSAALQMPSTSAALKKALTEMIEKEVSARKDAKLAEEKEQARYRAACATELARAFGVSAETAEAEYDKLMQTAEIETITQRAVERIERQKCAWMSDAAEREEKLKGERMARLIRLNASYGRMGQGFYQRAAQWERLRPWEDTPFLAAFEAQMAPAKPAEPPRVNGALSALRKRPSAAGKNLGHINTPKEVLEAPRPTYPDLTDDPVLVIKNLGLGYVSPHYAFGDKWAVYEKLDAAKRLAKEYGLLGEVCIECDYVHDEVVTKIRIGERLVRLEDAIQAVKDTFPPPKFIPIEDTLIPELRVRGCGLVPNEVIVGYVEPPEEPASLCEVCPVSGTGSRHVCQLCDAMPDWGV